MFLVLAPPTKTGGTATTSGGEGNKPKKTKTIVPLNVKLPRELQQRLRKEMQSKGKIEKELEDTLSKELGYNITSCSFTFKETKKKKKKS